MKINCFGIHLTFGKQNINSLIERYTAGNKLGYMCIVDFNVIANSFTNKNYNKILNKASFNTCDGSSLAFLRNIKYNSKLKSYNGPEIFGKYISKRNIRQLIIGASLEEFEQLKIKLSYSSHINHLSLPICKVDDFDYNFISKEINGLKPQIIWVLLGAPKQEIFIDRILSTVNAGLFLGAGAALKFYLGEINNRTFSVLGLRFIWFDRLIKEPVKQLKRICKFLLILPRIIKSI